MTQVNDVDVNSAEVFRAAADAARKALEVGISDDAAPSTESGSSPAIGAESVVPVVSTPEPAVVSTQEAPPEVKPEGVVIDPDAAWNEYKTDEERKKALAHNKAYAAEMSRKARDLEAKLAEKQVVPETPAVPETPVAETVDEDYDTWVGNALKDPNTEEKRKIAALASEYNQFIAKKVTPAEESVAKAAEAVREAESKLAESNAAMKFLQTRKDPALYESDIAEAKEANLRALIELNRAENVRLSAVGEFEKAERERYAMLGVLRNDARSSHESEAKTRRDSVSTRLAKESEEKAQKEVDEAWERAKLEAVTARGAVDEETKQFLLNAADGAIIRAANSNRTVSVADYSKFISEAWKPLQLTAEKSRQDAVKQVIEVTSEPGPAKATSEKSNVDAQPVNYNEWRNKARAVLSGKAA